MSQRKVKLQVILPQDKKVNENVDMVIMRCVNGDMGVLAGHADYCAVLDFGKLRILNNEKERWLAIYGGIAIISNSEVTIFTHEAQWPDEIDTARAEADRRNIESKIKEKSDDLELQNDRVLLRKALVQIEVAASSLVDDDESLLN